MCYNYNNIAEVLQSIMPEDLRIAIGEEILSLEVEFNKFNNRWGIDFLDKNIGDLAPELLKGYRWFKDCVDTEIKSSGRQPADHNVDFYGWLRVCAGDLKSGDRDIHRDKTDRYLCTVDSSPEDNTSTEVFTGPGVDILDTEDVTRFDELAAQAERDRQTLDIRRFKSEPGGVIYIPAGDLHAAGRSTAGHRRLTLMADITFSPYRHK